MTNNLSVSFVFEQRFGLASPNLVGSVSFSAMQGLFAPVTKSCKHLEYAWQATTKKKIKNLVLRVIFLRIFQRLRHGAYETLSVLESKVELE